MESFSKAIGMVIFIVLIFMFPMVYQAQRYDTIAQSYVSNITDDFIDEICETGELSAADYTNFISSLNKSGNLYSVDLTIQNVELTKDASGNLTTSTKEWTNQYIIDNLFASTDGSNQAKMAMGSGSYVNVVVKNKSKTLSARLQQVFYATVIDNPTIYVTDGGVVR